MNQNQALMMKQQEEALRLKDERNRNEQIIRRQKEAEMIKNNNVKQMVRQQKLMAEERKEMVSYTFSSHTFKIGRPRKTVDSQKQIDKRHSRGKWKEDGDWKLSF